MTLSWSDIPKEGTGSGNLIIQKIKKQKKLWIPVSTLLCVGETAQEKEFGVSAEVLRTQLKIGLHGVAKDQIGKVWIAYEPVWSIGIGGTPAPVDYAEEMHKVIKDCLEEMFGKEGRDIPALYGGSVNPDNSNALIVQPDIDGLFTTRTAFQVEAFAKLIRDAIAACEIL